MQQQVAAIFGAGGRVGKSVALRFLEKGYRVAVVSRSGGQSLIDGFEQYKDSFRRYSADMSKAEDAVRVWKQIRSDFPIPVSVVFYNAATNVSKAGTFEASIADLRTTFETNTMSVYTVVQQALISFKELDISIPKAFIYTGNGLDDKTAFPRTPPGMLPLSMGKTASSQLIDAAAQSYGSKGYRFYYIDERLANGAPAYENITGPGHADTVWQLSQQKEQGDWRVCFVNGKGIIDI